MQLGEGLYLKTMQWEVWPLPLSCPLLPWSFIHSFPTRQKGGKVGCGIRGGGLDAGPVQGHRCLWWSLACTELSWPPLLISSIVSVCRSSSLGSWVKQQFGEGGGEQAEGFAGLSTLICVAPVEEAASPGLTRGGACASQAWPQPPPPNPQLAIGVDLGLHRGVRAG